jgi:hypothetical protein
MSGRKLKWLTVVLFASSGAGMLALLPTLTAAPAVADSADVVGGFHGGGFNDTALVMGPSGFPNPAVTYVSAANDLYLHSANVSPLFTPEGLYPITGVNSLTLDPSVAQGVEALDNAIRTATGSVEVFGYSQSSTIASLPTVASWNALSAGPFRVSG